MAVKAEAAAAAENTYRRVLELTAAGMTPGQAFQYLSEHDDQGVGLSAISQRYYSRKKQAERAGSVPPIVAPPPRSALAAVASEEAASSQTPKKRVPRAAAADPATSIADALDIINVQLAAVIAGVRQLEHDAKRWRVVNAMIEAEEPD